MKILLNWLSDNRLINLALAIGYALFIVFAHEWFVNLSVQIMNALSLATYELIVASIVGLVFFACLVFLIKAVKNREQLNRKGLLYSMATLLGLALHFFVLTEMNIEFIHALEFGLLGILVYPLVRRFGAVFVCVLPILFFDEWYQYQVLFDYVELFEFNDVVLDLLGIGLCLSFIKTFGLELESEVKPLLKRTETHILFGLALVAGGLLLSNVVVTYEGLKTSNTWLVLNAISQPYGFWRVHPYIGSTYHVLDPIVGLVASFLLCFAYLGMDSTNPEK